jgi:large repetitive protein
VVTDASAEAWEGPYEKNNDRAVAVEVNPLSADLVIKSITTQPTNFSGEKTIVEWTVENIGGQVWAGTRYWTDEVWISPDPVFIRDRATLLGQYAYSALQPLGTGDQYTQRKEVILPRGIDGQYFIHVIANAPHEDYYTRDNESSLDVFGVNVYEDLANNRNQAAIPVIYREPDLQVTNLTVPTITPKSGTTFPISWTVTNIGTRATREMYWEDRVYLSRDASLDFSDRYLGATLRQGILEMGQSYTSFLNITLPDGISGDYHLLVFTDANIVDINDLRVAEGDDRPVDANVYFQRGGANFRTMASVSEFKDEANNITGAALPIVLADAPDLQVTMLETPERINRGQDFEITYTVTNTGAGDTPPRQGKWQDLIYLSRDGFLDLERDRYLSTVEHTNGLKAGESYTVTRLFQAPIDLIGPYYLFIVTDPTRRDVDGDVFEGSNELNNSRPSTQPLVIEVPPPSDLEVDTITLPSSAKPGERIEVSWTVSNFGVNAADGTWSDAVYLSADGIWDINDPVIGRVSFSGTLNPGETYTSTLETVLPPALPGHYRLIVRPDIFNQIYEAEDESNNQTTSASTLTLSVDELRLGVPLQTHLISGQEQLFQVRVEQGQTLKVTVNSTDPTAANELFIRYNQVPDGISYDAAYTGTLAPEQTAVIPTTEPGVYYVLVRGESVETSTTTITADILPFSITDVVTDRGGDGRYVTVTVLGAQFKPNAIIKLVRPGIAESAPARYEVVNSTEIRAIFDLRDLPHGLYDVKVINPDGKEAIVPYRYLVERAIETDVTVGLGGPRVLEPGQTGTYGVSIQSLTNLDTPYIHFQFGVPELGVNDYLLDLFKLQVREALGISELPYVQFTTNLRGTPEGVRTDVPWASLVSDVNTSGQILAPGYLFDLPTGGFVGQTFNTEIYPSFIILAEGSLKLPNYVLAMLIFALV